MSCCNLLCQQLVSSELGKAKLSEYDIIFAESLVLMNSPITLLQMYHVPFFNLNGVIKTLSDVVFMSLVARFFLVCASVIIF